MPDIQWKSEFSVHIDKIDRQHKMLIKILNEYNKECLVNKEEATKNVLIKMTKYGLEHFKTEEKLFYEYNYPATKQHIQDHEFFIKEIKELKKKYKNGDQISSQYIIQYLKNWLIEHISKSDKNYSRFLNDKGVH